METNVKRISHGHGVFLTGSGYPSTLSGCEHVFSITNVYNVGLTADFLVTII